VFVEFTSLCDEELVAGLLAIKLSFKVKLLAYCFDYKRVWKVTVDNMEGYRFVCLKGIYFVWHRVVCRN